MFDCHIVLHLPIFIRFDLQYNSCFKLCPYYIIKKSENALSDLFSNFLFCGNRKIHKWARILKLNERVRPWYKSIAVKAFQIKQTHFKVTRSPGLCCANTEQSIRHLKPDILKEVAYFTFDKQPVYQNYRKRQLTLSCLWKLV